MVFLDSPVAEEQAARRAFEGEGAEGYECVQWIDSVSDSKTVNEIRSTAVIMAGSGRGGYGRIQFHLERNAQRPESAIVFFGDKAGGTQWQSVEKGATLSILDQEVQVKAQVHRLRDPGVHLDASAVTGWLGRLRHSPKGIYIVHGGSEAKLGFQRMLGKSGMGQVHIPSPGERVAL
jgi:metallo-beta-lactamase family protein